MLCWAPFFCRRGSRAESQLTFSLSQFDLKIRITFTLKKKILLIHIYKQKWEILIFISLKGPLSWPIIASKFGSLCPIAQPAAGTASAGPPCWSPSLACTPFRREKINHQLSLCQFPSVLHTSPTSPRFRPLRTKNIECAEKKKIAELESL